MQIKLIEIAHELGVNVEFIKDLKKSQYVTWEKLENSYGVEIDLNNFMRMMTFISLRNSLQKNAIAVLLKINKESNEVK